MPGLVGQGPTAAPFPTSETVAASAANPSVGQRFKDTSGNEYVVVDFQQAFSIGEWAVMNNSYEASRPTSTSRGRVGIVVATVTASDTKGYVQIYGTYSGAWSTSGVTSAGLLFFPVTSDAGYVDELTTTNANAVIGAWARSAASTATSPGALTSTVLALIDVELNFPYCNNVASAALYGGSS